MNTSGFRVRGKLESTYDTVEQAITRASSKHTISKAEASRKRMNGAALTDWTLTLADINKHHKDDQTTLRAIMSAGLWDKHLLLEAGLAMDSRCDRRGKDRDDTYHRFWECTALKSTYEEDASLFQEFRYGEAPACLTTCGLAVELAGNVTGAFLGERRKARTRPASEEKEVPRVGADTSRNAG